MKKIVVIKIGSSVLMTKRNKLDEFRIAHIARQIKALSSRGVGIVLVISGAVAYGVNFVALSEKDSMSRQAAAGIGQMYVSSIFNTIFSQNKLQLAQVLLTKDYTREQNQRKNINNLLCYYLNSGFVPFINENDVIDLNSFGGNDYLALEISTIIGAQNLLILSTMKGGTYGVGGGETKQDVLRLLAKTNTSAVILNGKEKNVLTRSFVLKGLRMTGGEI